MNFIQRIVNKLSGRSSGGTGGITPDFDQNVDPASKDSQGNPKFTNAIKDVNADMARNELSTNHSRAAAEADEKAADQAIKNADELENSASGLEKPVNDSTSSVPPKGQGAGIKTRPNPLILYLAGGILGLLLISALVMVLRRTPAAATLPTLISPTTPAVQTPVPQLSGPKAGSLMAFGDGSVLVFIPDPNGKENNGARGLWITLNSISNYQFSLCVQAGQCQPPVDKNYGDPSMEDQPISLVGPDIVRQVKSQSYCGWMQGRIPTDAELALADGSVHSFGPEYGLSPDFSFKNGMHCIVDAPLPMPQYVAASPYYDPNQPLEPMALNVLKQNQFCQNGQGFQTIDFQLDKDASIVSVNGDGNTTCQVVNGSRVVCYGTPSTNPQAQVGLVCNGITNMRCQAGFDLNGAGCSNNMHGGAIAGMDDWELDSNGVQVPKGGLQPPGIQPAGLQPPGIQPAFVGQLPNGVLVGPLMINIYVYHGVAVAESLSLNGLPFNGVPLNGLSIQGMSINGSAGNGEASAGSCPQGYYFDEGVKGCASLGSPQLTCLAGYHFNSSQSGCAADQPNGNYPGCPAAQPFNPFTGQCEPYTQITSPTSHLMTESVQINFPDCNATATPVSDGSSGAGSCPAGQTYVCTGITHVTCSCK